MRTPPSPEGPLDGGWGFQIPGKDYDSFMGRYSRPLATQFADAADVSAGLTVLDVGCGPGALTGELVTRLGVRSVMACDPSAPFVQECSARHPGVDVRPGAAEEIPFDDASFDVVLAQLVLHFVGDPERALAQFRRVLRPQGRAAVCVWDAAGGMQMLRAFWDAALAVDPAAPDESRHLRFGQAGEVSELFAAAGWRALPETTLTVSAAYDDFDDLWSGFLAGVGPAGAYCLGLSEQHRAQVRAQVFHGLGSPTGGFSLDAVARCAVAVAP
ncbi:class I SAM-dependent methyltransferase [Allobranchiibius sp. CTAmp26]|uniref:class I SAM-dependent methyltransferase n=1 Tax=Allobranchiibius sp. CTAmp26 TaxID=2815214 RepID=UPI001AA0CE0C|nr:class I SAM-dependent methyltransferase [Allobranchiibius sp. CTAmp26]MBO1756018.1 class I SAM-dependent methyltransferase [Allobranchiibius sp. CTAmp26]